MWTGYCCETNHPKMSRLRATSIYLTLTLTEELATGLAQVSLVPGLALPARGAAPASKLSQKQELAGVIPLPSSA